VLLLSTKLSPLSTHPAALAAAAAGDSAASDAHVQATRIAKLPRSSATVDPILMPPPRSPCGARSGATVL